MLEFIINPIAGNGGARKTWERVEKWLQERHIEYQACFSEAPGHAIELARACVERGAEKVFCVGGDGTNYEVINGLKGTRTALGLIPAGTGNDFVKVLHMPKDPLAVMELLLDAPACPINVCTINDGIFLNVCGAGFDVEVLRGAAKVGWLGRGMLPYLLGVVQAVFHHHLLHIRVVIDGQERTEDKDLLLIGIANGQYIGGGMRIAPMARLDDDLLDIILVKPVTRRRIIRLLPAFIKGTYIRETDIVTHVRCRSIEVYGGDDLYVQTDGLVQPMSQAKMSISSEHQLLLVPESLRRQAGIGQGK